MDKETKLANLQKTSKVFAVIARVIEIVNYVGAAICAAAIPVLFIAQDKLQYFVSGQESDQLFQMLSISSSHSPWLPLTFSERLVRFSEISTKTIRLSSLKT